MGSTTPADAAIYGFRDALVGVPKQPRREPKIVDFAGHLRPDVFELEFMDQRPQLRVTGIASLLLVKLRLPSVATS